MRWLCLFFVFAACNTGKNTATGDCLTGKLVIKGICGQRVISVQDDPGKTQVNAMWIHPDKGDTLLNVFTVENICDFPADIDSGMVIKFRIVEKQEKDCMVCMAYTPVPEQSHSVAICQD